MNKRPPLRVGVGGPVGSGKTALVEALCKALRDRYQIAVVTNDIYTKEDMEILVRAQALAPERIVGVETGGCPHTAIREDASMNLEAIARLQETFPGLDLIFVESGGDNLAATFSPELSDLTLYVIDVAGRGKDPAQGWARDHQVRPPHHQQDRSGPDGGGLPGGHGPRQRDACAGRGPGSSPTSRLAMDSPRSSPSWSARGCWAGFETGACTRPRRPGDDLPAPVKGAQIGNRAGLPQPGPSASRPFGPVHCRGATRGHRCTDPARSRQAARAPRPGW